MFCFTIVSDDSPVRKRRRTIPLARSSDSDGDTQLLNDDESTPFYKNVVMYLFFRCNTWSGSKLTKTPERQEEAAPRENKRNTEEKNIICDERLGRSC